MAAQMNIRDRLHHSDQLNIACVYAVKERAAAQQKKNVENETKQESTFRPEAPIFAVVLQRQHNPLSGKKCLDVCCN